jgi:hypothetical protein
MHEEEKNEQTLHCILRLLFNEHESICSHRFFLLFLLDFFVRFVRVELEDSLSYDYTHRLDLVEPFPILSLSRRIPMLLSRSSRISSIEHAIR